MADHTAIEWCDATFNPWIGCTKISPACDHCYAEADMDHRRHRVKWGAGQQRSRTSVFYWKQPLRWNGRPFFECQTCRYRGDDFDSKCPSCHQHDFVPARRRVFCASLADVFDNEVPGSWRADLFGLIRATPNLDWLLLTKRIGNAERMMDDAGGWSGATADGGARNPLPNVWLGATICNQQESDRDIPKLLQVRARVRFLSMEPLLGAVDLRWYLRRNVWENGKPMRGNDYGYGTMVDWVIAGGESGPHARPMHPDWVRSLRDQCATAGVPFLFKQWGEWAISTAQADGTFDMPLPLDGWKKLQLALRGSQTFLRPSDNTMASEVFRAGNVIAIPAGKKRAGRTLDGTTHTAFPESR